MRVVGVVLDGEEPVKEVPKYGLTVKEVEFAIGSPDLVRQLRRDGKLRPCHEKPILFDAGDVARAWVDIIKK